jgi:hypothetical protein
MTEITLVVYLDDVRKRVMLHHLMINTGFIESFRVTSCEALWCYGHHEFF